MKNKKRTRPLLSICIPTKGRGEKALNNVKMLTKCPYDEEIEIVVSDNGTEGDDEYYACIEEMSRVDSRIVYKKYPPGVFCKSIEQVLGLTSGEFAVLCSDEDHMRIDKLDFALQHVFENRSKGGILFKSLSDRGVIFYEEYGLDLLGCSGRFIMACECGL